MRQRFRRKRMTDVFRAITKNGRQAYQCRKGEKIYLVSDRTHPVLLDALAKEYRVNYAEKKPSVMDKLKHLGSRNEPKICRKSEQER